MCQLPKRTWGGVFGKGKGKSAARLSKEQQLEFINSWKKHKEAAVSFRKNNHFRSQGVAMKFLQQMNMRVNVLPSAVGFQGSRRWRTLKPWLKVEHTSGGMVGFYSKNCSYIVSMKVVGHIVSAQFLFLSALQHWLLHSIYGII